MLDLVVKEIAAHPGVVLLLMAGALFLICTLLGVLARLLWPMVKHRVSPDACNRNRELMALRLDAGDREFATMRVAMAHQLQTTTELCTEIRGNCQGLKARNAEIIAELLRGCGPDDSQARNGA